MIAAARELFAAHGYANTTVEAIATAARVSPATVYAQCGGKEGLLGSLMDQWSSGDLVQRIIEDCASQTDPHATLDVLAQGYLEIYRRSGDIVRVISTAAASVPKAADFLEVANTRHLEALGVILTPLSQSGALREGLTVENAARMIFFHFHHAQFVLASESFGWGESAAAEWITGRIAAAILRSEP